VGICHIFKSMNNAKQLTNDQASDIIIAESFGRDAFKSGAAKAPVQDKRLYAMIVKHSGPIGTGIVSLLCAAWNKGQLSASLEA